MGDVSALDIAKFLEMPLHGEDFILKGVSALNHLKTDTLAFSKVLAEFFAEKKLASINSSVRIGKYTVIGDNVTISIADNKKMIKLKRRIDYGR
jgi:hypothetical protein